MALRLIAYNCDIIDGLTVIRNSEGDYVASNVPAELLDFIGEDFSDDERKEPYRELKVAWDIDQLAALILKLLPLSRVREIASPTHESGNIFYIPSKVLGINVDGHKSYIYHLIQYYDDEPPPDDVFKLHAMASEVVDAFKQMGLNPYKLTSPISVYESSVLNHMEIPNILDLPNKKEFDELIEWAETGIHKDWLENFAVGHWHSEECWDFDIQCYSDDTECLTDNGWKYIKDLTIGESILSFDRIKNKCMFQPVEHLHRSWYAGEMVSIEKEKINLLVTPNHRMLISNHIRCKNSIEYRINGRNSYSDWQEYEADKMPNGNCKIPVSYPIIDRPDYDVSDQILQLIAWINTEGHQIRHKRVDGTVINTRVAITQIENGNAGYCQEILGLLSSSGLDYNHRCNDDKYHYVTKNYKVIDKLQCRHVYEIKTHDVSKLMLDNENIHYIPLWILKYCSLRQLRLYFESLMKGDGSRSWKNNKIAKSSFFTKLSVNNDRMMYLCHLLGYNVRSNPPGDKHTTFQLFIAEDFRDSHNNQCLQYGDVHKQQYNGWVVCPTVQNGYIVVRRNGKSCISGNSSYGYTLSQLKSIKYAKFAKSRYFCPDADWGMIKGRITINEGVKLSPIVYTKNGRSCCPANGSTWEDIFDINDVRFVLDNKIGDFKPYDGWYCKYTAPVKPFEVPLSRVFDLRHKGGMVKKLAKRMCFSENTNIWTVDGIKNVKDVKVGDLAYSINPKTFNTEIKPVIAVNTYEYDGLMYHGKNHRYELMVTPEHKLLLARMNSNEYSFIEAKDVEKLVNKDMMFPVPKPVNGEKQEYISLWDYIDDKDTVVVIPNKRYSSTFEKDKRFKYIHSVHRDKYQYKGRYHVEKNVIGNSPDAFEKEHDCKLLVKSAFRSHTINWRYKTNDLLEYMGWYISEGNLHGKGGRQGWGIDISTHTQFTEQLHMLMVRMGIKHYGLEKRKCCASGLSINHRMNNKLISIFLEHNCNEYAPNKRIPEWVYKLDHSHLNYLFKSLMFGDGSTPKDRCMAKYSTLSKQLAVDFQRLCIHLGYKSRIELENRDRYHKRSLYRVFIYKNNRTMYQQKYINKEQYKGIVYGITVDDNHTILAGVGNKFEFVGQSAACWGKLIFKAADGKVNMLYNPIMAEQVVTNSRLHVAQFIYANNLVDHVLHIGIDGVLLDCKVKGFKDIVKMGEWRQEPQKDTLVISPGRVYTNEKKPGGLYYGDIMQMINDKPKESFYTANLKRRMTLTEAVELGDLSKLGTMIQTHSSVDLNLLRTGQNREFKDFPRTGKDLIEKRYYSEPVVIQE